MVAWWGIGKVVHAHVHTHASVTFVADVMLTHPLPLVRSGGGPNGDSFFVLRVAVGPLLCQLAFPVSKAPPTTPPSSLSVSSFFPPPMPNPFSHSSSCRVSASVICQAVKGRARAGRSWRSRYLRFGRRWSGTTCASRSTTTTYRPPIPPHGRQPLPTVSPYPVAPFLATLHCSFVSVRNWIRVTVTSLSAEVPETRSSVLDVLDVVHVDGCWVVLRGGMRLAFLLVI